MVFPVDLDGFARRELSLRVRLQLRRRPRWPFRSSCILAGDLAPCELIALHTVDEASVSAAVDLMGSFFATDLFALLERKAQVKREAAKKLKAQAAEDIDAGGADPVAMTPQELDGYVKTLAQEPVVLALKKACQIFEKLALLVVVPGARRALRRVS